MQKMEKKTMKPLTRAEMDVMNVLWDAEHALTVNEIVEGYAEPRPAYTTVATFLKILEAKGYVEHRKKEDKGSGRAIIALARKISRIVFVMLSKKEVFNPDLMQGIEQNFQQTA